MTTLRRRSTEVTGDVGGPVLLLRGSELTTLGGEEPRIDGAVVVRADAARNASRGHLPRRPAGGGHSPTGP